MGSCMSDETIKKATKCCNNYSCLLAGEGANRPQCIVEKCFDENMLLMKTAKKIEDLSCRYKLTIGNGNEHICTCPTRYVVYKRNKSNHKR